MSPSILSMHGRNHLPNGSDPINGLFFTGIETFADIVLADPCLFAYWPLTQAAGDDANDLGPNSLDLPPTGTPDTTAGPFPPATAYDFNDDSDFRSTMSGTLANTIFGGTHAFTVEALVYSPVNCDVNDPIFSAVYGSAQTVLYLSSAAGTNALVAQRGAVSSLGGSLPLTTWTHVAMTYDGSNLRVYVNAVLIDTDATTTDLGSFGTTHIGVGVMGTPFSSKTQEHISNVALYTCALSLATLEEHYAAFLSPTGGGVIPDGWVITADGDSATGWSWQPPTIEVEF